MTSLAKQLERLAVPRTQAIFGDGKQKKSLLFDPSEAALLDRDTFYSLGINGLEELQTIDDAFTKYEESLYADSSMSFERSLQTKEVNQKLDETLSSFLYRLSPYCLLKPAHKALEWLIHRYYIQEYNIDSLIMCVLPCHESKIFVRIVQLLNLETKIASKWDWLQPLQKSGVHLTKPTLINYCSTNSAFLSFVCDSVFNSVKLHQEYSQKKDDIPQLRTLFSFYTTTVIGVIDTGKVTEDLISLLLPHISRGLKSSVIDYKAATYMIIAQLLFKVKLKKDLLATLLQTICKYLTTRLLKEALSCILLMFQTQSISAIRKRSCKYLCSQSTLMDCLAWLTKDYQADSLLQAFLTYLIPHAVKERTTLATSGESSDSDSEGTSPQYLTMLHQLLSVANLSEQTAKQSIQLIIKSYVKFRVRIDDEHELDAYDRSLRSIVRLLEGRYSRTLDDVVEDVLQSSGSLTAKKDIQHFLNLSVLSIQHHSMPISGVSLAVSLHHQNYLIRKSAVENLLQNTEEDSDFTSESLLSRLQDDKLEVAEAVLSAGKTLWEKIKEHDKLIDVLQSLCSMREKKSKWNNAGSSALQILCSCPSDLQDRVMVLVLPYFLLTCPGDLELIEVILKSSFVQQSPLLKKFSQNLKIDNNGTLGAQTMVSVKMLTKSMKEVYKKNSLAMLQGWIDQCQTIRLSSLLLLIIDDLTAVEKVPSAKLQLLHLHIGMIQNAKEHQKTFWREGPKSALESVVEETCNTIVKFGLMPEHLITVLMERLIKNLMTLDMKTEDLFWQPEDTDTLSNLLVKVFDFLLDQSSSGKSSVKLYRQMVKQFTQIFKDMPNLFSFLGMIWTQHCNPDRTQLSLNATLQARALQIGKTHLQSLNKEQANSMNPEALSVTINLMLAMTSPHKALRELAMESLVFVESFLVEEQSPIELLVKKLIRCQPEIVADQDYLIQVMTSLFKNAYKEEVPDGSPRKRRRSLKKNQKLEALKLLTSVIVTDSTPLYIQQCLLNFLQNVNSNDLFKELFPLLKRQLRTVIEGATQSVLYDSIYLLLYRYTEESCQLLTPNSEELQILLDALSSSCCAAGSTVSVQQIAINQISKEFYAGLLDESQRKVFRCLVDVWTNSEKPSIATLIRRVIRQLSLNALHVVDEIQSCLKVTSASTVKQAKRLKREPAVSGQETEAEFERASWQRVTVLLESIQEKKKLGHSPELLPVCFLLLQRVLDSDQHASAEYIKQLILSLVYHVCRKIASGQADLDSVSQEKFNMELIVQCIRTSENPQTHHQSLLVLTTAAELYPEHLLHNIMSVFTFMGANILRQDDAYSIQIISRILETVIPALITACEQRKKVPQGVSNNIEDVITMVIRVFVDAFPHIPSHRRLMLFTKLMQIVGDKSYLWRLMLLLVEHMISRDTQPTNPNLSAADKVILSSDTEFYLQLCSQFTVPLQLSSASHIFTYISHLPEEKTDDAGGKKITLPLSLGKLKKEDTELFNVKYHTAKQLRHFKYEAVSMLISLFSSQDFVIQMSESVVEEMLPQVQSLVQNIMQFVVQVTQTSHKYQEQISSKFWRAFLHKNYELLEKVVNLLPEDMFIEVVSGLVDHSLPSVQRKALELLNTKLHKKELNKENEVSLLLPLVDKIMAVIKKAAIFGDDYEDNAVNAQTALYSLKLMCRNFGSKHPHTFIQVLTMCTQLFSERGDNQQVSACALLCVAEICNILKIHVISHLSSFMPKVLQCLQDHSQLFKNDLFLLSVVTTLQRVVENLSHFLSPYIKEIIYEVCCLSAVDAEMEVMKKPQLQTIMKDIRNALSTLLPTRVILPAVSECTEKVSKSNMLYLTPLMEVLEGHITDMSREELVSHTQQLQAFFMQCLEFRAVHTKVDEDQMAVTEGSVIGAVITMVMKMSEATFRPFLFELCDWATRDESTKTRVIVFYRLADSMAEKLRSLFTLFASHFVQHAAQMLEENNSSKTETGYFGSGKKYRRMSHNLVVYILDCLYKCFLYDTENFVNKERFDCLMQPLVDQLENTGKSDKQFRKRINGHLIPCVIQFAIATQDDSLWKVINYQILLKTRSQESKVRFAALRMVDEFHKKLGEDYMTLLPETIPFLAELMEDECEEVEKECQSVIAEMEKTLGEPLQKYF